MRILSSSYRGANGDDNTHLVTEEQVVMRILSSSYRRASGDDNTLI